MSEYYKFFQNKKCEYFPCHKGIPEADFNCLFCYCPLYTLGKSCGGNFEYLKNGSSVGLVTDRGTPIISDPGYKTVKYISDNNYNYFVS